MRDRTGIFAPETHGGDPGARYDFSISTNPYGPPAAFVAALSDAALDRYENDQGWRQNSDGSATVDGAGTTELIYRISRTFARPGDVAVVLDPTFGEYARAGRVAGLTIWNRTSSAPLEFPDRTRLVWLCQPNNPDGRILPRERIDRLRAACRKHRAILVVDAAFAPLCRESVPLPEPAQDVILLHSPTKLYGVPGIRYGYAVTGGRTAARLASAAPPWLLGAPARLLRNWVRTESAATFVQQTVPRHLEDAAHLQQALAELGWPVRAAPTGYFTLGVNNAARLVADARRDGIALRLLESFGLPGVRIAARRPEANQALIEWFATQRRGR